MINNNNFSDLNVKSKKINFPKIELFDNYLLFSQWLKYQPYYNFVHILILYQLLFFLYMS